MRDAARRKEPFEDQAVHDCEDREAEEGCEANEQEVAREVEHDEHHASQDEWGRERFDGVETAAEVAGFEGEAQQRDEHSQPRCWSCTGEAEPNVDVVDVTKVELEPDAEDDAQPTTARDLEEDQALISE